jgi:Cys-rich protein (TIGR01571 family)
MGDDEKDWEHGLCGCFGNAAVCLVTYFVPCYTAGMVADKIGDSCIFHSLIFFVPGLGCFCGALERHKLREKHNIEGSMIGDFLAWYICPLCALVQESQEIDAISFGSKDEKEGDKEEGKPLKLERK